jgi:N-methylhydantoinase A
VGSAIGFLRAPVGYEVVRSLYQRLSSFEVDAVNALLDAMAREAEQVVAEGGFGAPTRQERIAYMRYVGQGHEIPVKLPARRLTVDDVSMIREAYETEYTAFYDRPVPGSDIEVMSYAVTVATAPEEIAEQPAPGQETEARPVRTQKVRDTATGQVTEWAVHDRPALSAGALIAGPAIVAEDETSTMIGPGWSGRVNGFGYIEMTREAG